MPPVHPDLCDAGVHDDFRALMDALPLPSLASKKGPVPGDDRLGELGATGRLVGNHRPARYRRSTLAATVPRP
jgi:hypothetical protein